MSTLQERLKKTRLKLGIDKPRRSPSARSPGKHKESYASGALAFIRMRAKAKNKKATPTARLLSEGAILSDVKEWISTGMRHLDRMMGGGWPVGRTVEVFGPEGSGKSALCQLGCVQAQKGGGEALVEDFELSFDPPKMRQLGMREEHTVYDSPDCMEDGWDEVDAFLDYLEETPPVAPCFGLWDSIAAAKSRHELEADSVEDEFVAEQARIMSRGLRRSMRKFASVRACMVFVNQEREGMSKGSRFKELVTPGGRAAKFYCSLRLRVTVRERITRGETVTGYLVKVQTAKCRLTPPHQTSYFVLDFKHGPSPELTALYLLKKTSKMRKKPKTQSYTLPGGGTFSGNDDDWVQRMREDKEFATKINAALDTIGPLGDVSKIAKAKGADDDDDDDDDDVVPTGKARAIAKKIVADDDE